MEVGCLTYPGASTIGSQPLDWNNAPMTGTTAQPSHEPPHQRKGTGTRHTDKSISGEKPNRPRGRAGGEETQHEGKTECAKESHDRCSQPPSIRMLKTADLGTQVLLVVNSFKLHLTAWIALQSFGIGYFELPLWFETIFSQRVWYSVVELLYVNYSRHTLNYLYSAQLSPPRPRLAESWMIHSFHTYILLFFS